MSIENVEVLDLSYAHLLRLQNLRKKLFDLILHENEISGGYHKSYEGRLDLTLELPNIWEDGNTKPYWNLHLACYLLCSGRSDDWSGPNITNVLDQFESWLNSLHELEGSKKNE